MCIQLNIKVNCITSTLVYPHQHVPPPPTGYINVRRMAYTTVIQQKNIRFKFQYDDTWYDDEFNHTLFSISLLFGVATRIAHEPTEAHEINKRAHADMNAEGTSFFSLISV